MTYNAWILISVILGSGVAHLVLRPMLMGWIQKTKENNICTNNRLQVLHDFPDNDVNGVKEPFKPGQNSCANKTTPTVCNNSEIKRLNSHQPLLGEMKC